MRVFALLLLAFLAVTTARAQAKPAPDIASPYLIEIRMHYATKPHATPAPRITLDTFAPFALVHDSSTARIYVQALPKLGIRALVVPHRNADGTITVNVNVTCDSPNPTSKLTVTRTLQLGFSTHLGTLTYNGDAISVGITLALFRTFDNESQYAPSPLTLHPSPLPRPTDPFAAWKITLLKSSRAQQ